MSNIINKILYITFFTICLGAVNALALVTSPDTVQISLDSPSGTSISPGQTFNLVVKVDDSQYQNSNGKILGMAGAAVTIDYDSTAFEVVDASGSLKEGELDASDIGSNTFKSYTDDRPNPGTPAQAILRVGNNEISSGKVRVSGAYVDSTTGDGAYTGPQSIFAVTFKAKSTASGTYNFTLEKSVPKNVGGWDGSASVEPLVGVVDGWEDDGTPTDYSDDFGDIAYSFPTASTTINVGGPVDSDGDGWMDDEEIAAGSNPNDSTDIPPFTPSDFNDDGIVNYLDLAAFADYWLMTETNSDWLPYGPKFNVNTTPDSNNNQIINYLDLGVLADSWLSTAP